MLAHAGSLRSRLKLKNTDFGILCVTAENQQAPWLNFEAGALAKAVDANRVVPLAIGLSPAEIQLPLAQFQAQPLTQVGMGKIVSTVNSALSKPLPAERVDKAMGKWWPDLESEIRDIEQRLILDVVKEPVRSDRQLLEDILNDVRGLVRRSDRRILNAPRSLIGFVGEATSKNSVQNFLTEYLNALEEIESLCPESVELMRRPIRELYGKLQNLPPVPDKSSDE